MPSTLLKNFFSLSLVQVVNQLVPLLVIPVVLPVIGLEAFAQVAFVQSLATVMSSLVDYGFTYSATRRVSVHRSDKVLLNNIVSEVMSTRLLVFWGSVLAMAVVFAVLPVQTGGLMLYVGALCWVLGNALWPQWFFLGIERMHWITIINAFSKLLFFLAVVLLLQRADQAYMLILFFGLANIMAAMAAFVIMKAGWDVRPAWAGWRRVITQLREGWPLFVSTASTTSLVNSNVLVLGLFVQGAPLGLFGLAEKILLAVQQILSTFSQATFSALCNVAAARDGVADRLRRFIVRNYLWFYFVFVGLLMTAFISAGWIMRLMGGQEAADGGAMLRLLLPVAMLIAFNIIPGQLLLAVHRDTSYRSAFLVAALANLALNFLLAPAFGATGTAIAMWATHIVLNLMLWIPAFRLVRKH
ncbi:MAG: oligosaccharide flippase family protein [Bacteroidetes bacterium]|nr:oligosaccharide flippase family protein [Bacteroidota bacterium]